MGEEEVQAAANKRRGYLSHITRLVNESNALTAQSVDQKVIDILSSNLTKLSEYFKDYVTAHQVLLSELIQHKPEDKEEFSKFENRHANVSNTYSSSREKLESWLSEAQESLRRSSEHQQPESASFIGRPLSLHVSESTGVSGEGDDGVLKSEFKDSKQSVDVSTRQELGRSSGGDAKVSQQDKEWLALKAGLAKVEAEKQMIRKRQELQEHKFAMEKRELEERIKLRQVELELQVKESELQMLEQEERARHAILKVMDQAEDLSEKSFNEALKWVESLKVEPGGKEKVVSEDKEEEMSQKDRHEEVEESAQVPVSQSSRFRPNPEAPTFVPQSATYCVPPYAAYNPCFSTPMSPRPESADASVVAAAVTAHLTLPRPELLVFKGDSSEYPSFISNFKMHIGSQAIASRHKLSYLLQFCEGSAKEAIKECVVLPEEEGYEEALKILHQEFGKPHKIVKSYLKALTEGASLSISDSKGLVELARKMRSCQLALKNETYLNLSSEDILSKIARRLPMPLRVKWVEKASRLAEEGKHPTFEDLLKFVRERASISSSEFADILRDQRKEVKSKKEEKKPLERKMTLAVSSKEEVAPVSASSNGNSSSQSRKKCVDCGGNHWLIACEEFKKKSVKDRLEVVRRARLCFNCLQSGHRVSDCSKPSYCREEGCKLKHSKFLHYQSSSSNQRGEKSQADEKSRPGEKSTVSTSCTTSSGPKVCLQVVKVLVESNQGVREANALIDQCSDATFCTKELSSSLKVKGKSSKLQVNTVSGQSEIKVEEVSLTVRHRNGSSPIKLNQVLAVDRLPKAAGNAPCQEDIGKWPHLKGVEVFQDPIEQIDLLIGVDNPVVFHVLETRRGKEEEPYAIRYSLGWTVIGPIACQKEIVKKKEVNTNFISSSSGELSLESQMSELWNTEFNDLPTSKIKMSEEDKRALEVMESSATLDSESHWNIRLPWKEDPPFLPGNRFVAERRLEVLRRKLQRDPDLHEEYTKKMESYIESGYAVEVQKEDNQSQQQSQIPEWFLPHHAVIHPQKKKLRVVFDCSAEQQNTSLNDQLLQGPDFLNSLVGVLLRFRQEQVAIAADVEAMFHQVRVERQDQEALKFLWFKGGKLDEEPTEYRMVVHLFGAKSSPSVCCYAMRRTAEEEKAEISREAFSTVLENFYMDDLLKSVPSEAEAIKLKEELVSTLKKGGFNLSKWISNKPEVVGESQKQEESVKELKPDQQPIERALGVSWNTKEDSFQFRVVEKDKPSTRRGVLSYIHSLYDPLGFTAPVLLLAKQLLQLLCLQKLGWDEEMPKDLEARWLAWKASLPKIQEVRVARCYYPSESGTITQRQLHVFSDASEKGYGVAAYLRATDEEGRVHTALVLGKARVSPAKCVSIPRLELSAAALAAKVSLFIREEMQQDLDEVVFWTDSTTVLKYLSSTSGRFKVFVANRIAIIKEVSQPSQWRYVPTKLNPADAASRGVKPSDTESLKKWIQGPKFLLESEEEWPQRPDESSHTVAGTIAEEAVDEVRVEEKSVLDKFIESHSSWLRLQRVTAWILRFINKCKQRHSSSSKELLVEEIQEAAKFLVKHEQSRSFKEEVQRLEKGKCVKRGSRLEKLSPELDEARLLRVGGRLSKASISYNAKHPLILPSDSHLSTLIARHQHQQSSHAGVDHVLANMRQEYWVLGGRAVVKKVIRSPKNGCALCKRLNVAKSVQKMADLPESRVVPREPPFSTVGIDFFGPFFVKFKRGTTKRYGCIFTCFTSRAVHLEVAHTLDTNSFLACFQRFVARRGYPKSVYSDNGTNLVAGCKEIKEQLASWNQARIADSLSQQGVQWHFNPPAASHMGGVWERLIRSVRSVLQRVLKEQIVNDEQLLTIMTEAEKIVNDRPLWSPSEDPEAQPLTPSELLLLRSNAALPMGLFSKEDSYARSWWKQANYLVNVFWKRWIKEYLPLLQTRSKWYRPRVNLQTGDVVLVVDENASRGQWPLGRVTAVYPDSKGVVRAVDIRVGKSVKRRPIHKLCLLEQA